MDRLVLIVEDDASIARLMERVLIDEGFAVASAGDADAARSLIGERSPDVAVLDLMIPGLDGREFCRSIRSEGFEAPILIVSAQNHADRVAEELGASFLRKPFDIDEFVAMVADAAERAP